MTTVIIVVSFLSGILTVLAPCVLPLLPVILGGGLSGASKWRPYIIIGSLILSLLIFTLLLKISTALIGIDPVVWEYVSGGLLIAFSITLIFPKVWVWVTDKTGLEKLSNSGLQNAGQKEGIWGPIALGAALGPVFSSCNPTYSVLLATILPQSISLGLLGLLFYFIGLGLVLLLVVHFGRKATSRFGFFTNPNGLFRKLLGVLILVIGLLIVSGYIKDVETYIVQKGIFINTASIDSALNEALFQDDKTSDAQECSDCVTGENFGPAPEVRDIQAWINSDPLTLESLKGKVVLVDFWTYSCINCIRTQPYLNSWYEKYADQGFVILGIHAPEFAFEKVESNVRAAVKDADIKYPVALDNDFSTWRAYENHYWPAKYLIDKNGDIVYKHFGEGKYEETEMLIQQLLGTSGETTQIDTSSSNHEKTPETYLGSRRAKNMVLSSGSLTPGDQSFEASKLENVNEWTLMGPWSVDEQYIESLGDGSVLELRFAAKKVFLVVSADSYDEDTLTVEILDSNGEVASTQTISVSQDELYTVYDGEDFTSDTTLRITPSPGLRLHAFTFGS